MRIGQVNARSIAPLFAAAFLGCAVPLSQSATAVAATPSIAQATEQYEAAKARLDDLSTQVEHTQGRLDAVNRQLAEDAIEEQKVGQSLNEMARYQYTQPALPIRLLSARSLGDVLATIQQMRVVGSRQQALLDRQRAVRRRDQQAHDEEAALLHKITADRAQAQDVADKAQATLTAAQGEAARQASASLAARASAIGSTPVQGAAGNHFTYGYCTWYVANKRPVPWYGNAIEWWPNARAYGFAEGSTPRPGAIMVTRESGTGHVAYVESVNADGSWTVSEMNYVAWGVVSSRTLRPGQAPVVGFIY